MIGKITYWEDYEDALEDAREEAEERWEDEREALRKLRKRGVFVPPPGRNRYYEYYAPDEGYRVYRHPRSRYYYDDRPVYRSRYWHEPRYYRYRGPVHAGPVRVYYGPSGAVHVGPIHVYWD